METKRGGKHNKLVLNLFNEFRYDRLKSELFSYKKKKKIKWNERANNNLITLYIKYY